MPEYVRRTISENHPRVLCPALEEGAELPPGLTPEQRLCLTQGRLAADYAANLLIEKRNIAKGYGMGITIVNEQEPMKMMQAAPLSEESTETKSFFSRIKETVTCVKARVKKLWIKK